MKGRLSSFFESHIPLVGFSVFVALSFIALIIFQSKALKEMRERNDRILAHYSQVLSISSEQNPVDAIDYGLISNEFKMTPPQRLVFQEYSKKVIETAVAQSHVDLEVNSIVAAKATAMYQETKDLLEMQFAKIQHETESLEIWCGILTVVFLIFSFYSLFKTDELVNQGREGVKELASLQESGKKSIEEMKRSGMEKVRQFESTSSEAIMRAGRKAILERRQIEESINKINQGAQDQVAMMIEEANRLLDNKYDSLSKALENKHKEVSSLDESIENESLRQMYSKLENLGLRIDEVERLIMKGNG